MTAALPTTTCPNCAQATVSVGLPQRWCPACEWNLDQAPNTVVGWKWADRRLHRLAARQTTAQFTALAHGPLARRRTTTPRLITTVAALVLLAGVLAIGALGLWLTFATPGGFATVQGVLLLAVAVLLRPRLGRLNSLVDDAIPVDRSTAPSLFDLIDRVAAATGAPKPHVVLLGYDLNAFSTTTGLRRRRVLSLGVPLLAVLDPQERVAVIGHELGHFVNGDVRRGPLTQVATTTLARLAYLFAPPSTGAGSVFEAIVHAPGWLISRAAMSLQLLLLATSQRDSQRAEYLADELGARAGGSAAAIRATEHLLRAAAIDTVIQREARAGNGLTSWRTAAEDSGNVNPALLRQLSRHTEPSLFASHPPLALRAEMLEHRPPFPAAVTLDSQTSARIDAEMAPFESRVRRVVADGGLIPARRPMRRSILMAAGLAVLGFITYQIVKPDISPRTVVVMVTEDADPSDYTRIESYLEDVPGVTDLAFDGYPGLSRFPSVDDGGLITRWNREGYSYQLTVRDRNALKSLESSPFAGEVAKLPGVLKVYFNCPNLDACRAANGDD